MKTLISDINQILTEWDPIGVGSDIAQDEYCGYIPMILRTLNRGDSLMSCLIDIIVIHMGMDYNPSDQLQTDELSHVYRELISTYGKYK